MPDAPGERSEDEADPSRRSGEADAWSAFSYVLSGMLLWGGVGWFLSRWLDSQVPLALGLMGGTAGGLVLVWLRYGRSL
jgi:ATP synthase protein I